MGKASVTLLMVFVLTTAMGCSTARTLPSFEYNGKSKNRWIVNRVPDYGDGRRDGCVIMGELNVSLEKNSLNKYSGNIKDVEEDEPVRFASFVVNAGLPNEKEVQADQHGAFTFNFPWAIETITFKGHYQRHLRVEVR